MATPRCSTAATAVTQTPAYTPSQQCTGGRQLIGGQCVCPSGTQWNGTSCVAVTPTQQKPGIPGTPYQVSASASGINPGEAFLTIGWSYASDTTSYKVIDPINGNIVADNISGTTNQVAIGLQYNLTAGSSISLAVVAINSAGSMQGGTAVFTLPCPDGYTNQNGYCIQNQTVPPAPSPYANGSPILQSDGTYIVPIAWNPVENFDVTEYDVWDQYYGNTFSVGLNTSANLTGVAPGTTIPVYVRAVNSAGDSDWGGPVIITTPQPSCPSGQYWNGSQCVNNPATQNISAYDCTSSSSDIGSGCFTACWDGAPVGTTDVEIWHVDPNTGEGISALATGINPYATFQSVCGLYPGATETWNIRAYANGSLVGYSNVVQSTIKS